MIPKKIHFIFGLDPNFGCAPFSLYHYLGIKSAKVINPSYEINLYYFHEPSNNEYWEKSKSLCNVYKLTSIPDSVCGIPVYHTAHKADVLRMDILWEQGGIYLDVDTICISPFDPLLDKKTVMGMEIVDGYINGLCNAVILTAQKSEFFEMWRNEYSHFNPDDWNEMSVRKPFELYRKNPSLIYVLSPEAFFRTSWTKEDLDDTYNKVIHFDRSYCLHLWETLTYKDILKNITEEDILNRDSSYNLLARKILKS